MRVAIVVVLMLLTGAPAFAIAQTALPRPPAASASPAPPSTATPVTAPHDIAGRVLSLPEAIAIALETQPLIQARLHDYAAARYRVQQAFSPLLPQVVTVVTTQRSHGLSGAVTFDTGFDENLTARISLSQLLFDFGKTYASTEVQRKLAEVSREDVELQRQLITLAVKEAYTNINFGQRLIRVQEQALERAELNLRSARGFFDVGTRPKSDVTRAEVDVANARVDVIRARNAERLARVALNTAMGIPVDIPTTLQDNLVYEPTVLERAALMDLALKSRPEYRQAKLRADAAAAAARRALRDFFPDLTGGASYGGVGTDLQEVWELTVSLRWSILEGGNRLARYRETRSLIEAEQARIRSVALDIARDVEQTQITVTEAEERIQAAQKAVESAQENFRLAQGRFDAGVGTILELTDAQLELTRAQNTEAQALADYRIALARLDRALGRR
jgi:outer membrane protein TolC